MLQSLIFRGVIYIMTSLIDLYVKYIIIFVILIVLLIDYRFAFRHIYVSLIRDRRLVSKKNVKKKKSNVCL